MKSFLISDIPDKGISVNENLSTEWLDEHLNQGVGREELATNAVSDGKAELNLRKIAPESTLDPVIRVTGRVSTHIKTHCVRCLEFVDLQIDTQLDQTLFPADSGFPGSSEDSDLAEDAMLEQELHNLNDDVYSGQTINLPAIVREAILLELDMNTTCAEGDACETRTNALIDKVTQVEEEQKIDPRWAALKKFQLKSE